MTSRPAKPRFSYAVASLERSIRRAMSDALRPFDLTVAQYTVLWLMGNLEGLSNAQLARRAYITPQAMNEVLRHLERRGLAARSQSPTHARIHPAHLTEAGWALLEQCDVAVDAMEEVMLEDIDDDQQATMIDLLIATARRMNTR